MDKKFSLEEFKQVIWDYFKDKAPEKSDPGYIGPLEDGWYRIGNNCITDEAGFRKFEEELKRLSNGES